jgi:hypothetical protein
VIARLDRHEPRENGHWNGYNRSMIYLTRTDPTRRLNRFYIVTVTPRLFGASDDGGDRNPALVDGGCGSANRAAGGSSVWGAVRRMIMKAQMYRYMVLLLLICPAASHAETIVWGPGNSSCGDWLRDRQRDSWGSVVKKAWLSGYVTAYNNAYAGALIAGTDSEGMFAWVDNYCRSRPLDSIFQASNSLMLELVRRTTQSRGR